MTDFESRLRTRLVDAAEAAPVFTGLDPERVPAARGGSSLPPSGSSGPRRTVRLLAVAAAVAVAVAAGGLWWADRSRDPGPDAASCPSELVLDGSVYVGNGGLVRLPRPGPSVGTATRPPCGAGHAEGTSLETFRVPGADPSVAVLADGTVWVSKSLNEIPPELRDLYTPTPCTGDGQRDLAGQLTAANARVTQDYHPVTPYTATFVADQGAGLRLDRYSSVTLEMRVTSSTEAGADPHFLRQALGNGERAQVTVRCDGPRFVAVAFALR